MVLECVGQGGALILGGRPRFFFSGGAASASGAATGSSGAPATPCFATAAAGGAAAAPACALPCVSGHAWYIQRCTPSGDENHHTAPMHLHSFCQCVTGHGQGLLSRPCLLKAGAGA